MEPNKNQIEQQKKPKSQVWDCGSTLYDSFELKSFKLQLDSAIASSGRTLSMPHLPDRRMVPAPQKDHDDHQAPMNHTSKRTSSRISRSLQKFVRSIFRSKPNGNNSSRSYYGVVEKSNNGVYAQYDKFGSLTTIPELPEIDHHGGFSPEINGFVGRTRSERFTPSSISISCA